MNIWDPVEDLARENLRDDSKVMRELILAQTQN
jgi:hypothetical protein